MDIELAYTVNGEKSNIFPKKGSLYEGKSVECEGKVTANWDNEDWGLVDISNPDNEKIKCKINFEITAVDYIKTIAQTETDELVTDNTQDANIRYIGKNPDNYVEFNGEKWRIIGVMNNVKDESGNTASRIKLIKSNSIGSYSWHNQNNNNWENSPLQKMLNETYYQKGKSEECPNGNTTISCDFSGTGLTDEAKQMITKVEWNLGGIDHKQEQYNLNTTEFYEKERGKEVYESNPSTWTGNIGLIYPSDYGYATSGSEDGDRESCLTKKLHDYDEEKNCSNNNWLYTSTQWTMTPDNMVPDYVYEINGSNPRGAEHRALGGIHVIRPVVFLDTNIKIAKGTGTDIDPYILKLE